ncbi:ABC transporter transmembrane domain-containing protein [Niallia taxi]|uniref:ABC transporter ATP-binding protein n=1 Tax=Niallia taxi TaxID=2499688 RepID=UPI00124727F7|nr:ABC transporter transmembrane domain-containing protein [Niallia taxi]MCM3216182.1 ABC transporter transmembrane domain-containing protein [Niallia taxi]MED4053107.1 ABC transporter transmembrane domain-containing protein [Niallia taxi]MED4118947.1 ABC transporter transmembrane domain-containing protein [Niallia taxi]
MFSILFKLKWFFKEHWKRYTIAITLLILVGVIDILPPQILGMFIDEINVGSLTSVKTMQYIAAVAIITISSYAITYFWMYKLFGGAFVLERKLRSNFMGHLLKMTPTFFQKNRTGDLMARATNDLKAISITAGFGILTLIDSTAFMITILITMCLLVSWKLTLAAILPLPIMAIIMKIYGDRIHKRFTEAQDAFGDLNDRVLQSIGGVRVIRAYVLEKDDEKEFHQMTEDVYNKNIQVAKIDSLFEPTIRILVGLSYIIGLGYGSYLVFQQQITIGQLVSFNVYLGMIVWPMFAIGELMNVMQRGNASLDRVQETLDYKPDVLNPSASKELVVPDVILFDSVQFQYPSSAVTNLNDINLRVNRGETIGVVGKTGSGKTTLVKQLLREYPKGQGELSINGTSIDEINLQKLRSWIGYVPQDHVLFSKSVKENILFGNLESATEEQLEEAIRLASFNQDIEMLPEGLETLVGEKGVALSGGQKQRISIARALIRNPEILILDDSLSAVDAKTEQNIIQNIKKERSGKTTIITTHRMTAVQHADQIIVLEDGKIMEHGSHEQLLQKNGWYKEQFEIQQTKTAQSTGIEVQA